MPSRTPFARGYQAGLHNERRNPFAFWELWEYIHWEFGNDLGVTAHCAIVEAIYLRELEHG